jgi:hypothetical protein
MLFLLLAATPAWAGDGWQHFESPRFGVSIDIPSGFVQQEPGPANNDGATFLSPDGSAELRVWGSHMLSGSLKADSRERQQFERDDGWKITYAPAKDGWYAYSGLKKDRIVYAKAVGACGNSMALYFRIEYPKNEKTHYDAMVTRLSRSLKYGPALACPE